LNRLGAPIGHRRKSRWTARHVRRIPGNEKYIGIWRWGQTRTVRNSKGKKRQDPVPAAKRVTHHRPDLRIVEQPAWDKAQPRLRELNDIFGSKVGQKRRGPRVHHLDVYPGSLLGGLLYCGLCGRRMWYRRSGKRTYLACPNCDGNTQDSCPMKTTVSVAKAEKAILDFLSHLLLSLPDWVAKALTAMRRVIQEAATRIPQESVADERLLAQLDKKIANLVDALADGAVESDAIVSRLGPAEAQAKDLRRRIEDARRVLAVPVAMPNDAWIADRLKDLPSLIHKDERRAAILLRKIFGKVHAFQVLPPGKQRGYAYLRLRVNGWELLRSILDSQISPPSGRRNSRRIGIRGRATFPGANSANDMKTRNWPAWRRTRWRPRSRH